MKTKVHVNNEYGRLRSVLLNLPLPNISHVDPKKAMYTYSPNYLKVIQEFAAYAELLEDLGVEVHLGWDMEGEHPNWVYTKDLAFVYGHMIIVGNPKWSVRHGEQHTLYGVLLSMGLHNNVVRLPDNITMEGADIAWLRPARVLLASVGNRTSRKFIPWFRENISKDISWATVKAHPEGVPQHLQGTFRIVDEDLIFWRPAVQDDNQCFPDAVEVPDTYEVTIRYAMNFVQIGPREIVMPTGCPDTKKFYEYWGVRVHTTPMDEISKMAGAMACMTLPLWRDNV